MQNIQDPHTEDKLAYYLSCNVLRELALNGGFTVTDKGYSSFRSLIYSTDAAEMAPRLNAIYSKAGCSSISAEVALEGILENEPATFNKIASDMEEYLSVYDIICNGTCDIYSDAVRGVKYFVCVEPSVDYKTNQAGLLEQICTSHTAWYKERMTPLASAFLIKNKNRIRPMIMHSLVVKRDTKTGIISIPLLRKFMHAEMHNLKPVAHSYAEYGNEAIKQLLTLVTSRMVTHDLNDKFANGRSYIAVAYLVKSDTGTLRIVNFIYELDYSDQHGAFADPYAVKVLDVKDDELSFVPLELDSRYLGIQKITVNSYTQQIRQLTKV